MTESDANVHQEPIQSDVVSRYCAVLGRHIPRLRERYKVRRLALFGSHVRNEQTRTSDLDVLAEFDEAPGLFDFVRLEDELSELLGVKVDLVMRESLKPSIGKRIMEEAVFL